MSYRFQPLANRAGFRQEIEVLFAPDRKGHQVGDQVLRALPIQYECVNYEDLQPFIEEPTFTLSPEQAAQLMDQLWECGIRPSSGEGNLGQIGALKYHLEDMRKLVFEGKP